MEKKCHEHEPSGDREVSEEHNTSWGCRGVILTDESRRELPACPRTRARGHDETDPKNPKNPKNPKPIRGELFVRTFGHFTGL